MSAWIKTPTGVKGSLYGKKIWIDKLRNTKIGAKARYRLTIEGVSKDLLPEQGLISSIKIGKEIAFTYLQNLSVVNSHDKSATAQTASFPATNSLNKPNTESATISPSARDQAHEDNLSALPKSTYPFFSRPVINKKND